MAVADAQRQVPFEDWRLWRTELNNGLVKKMFTGELGHTVVPFDEYLQYPNASNYAGSVAIERQANALLMYGTAAAEQSALPKKNFLNYGIPRVAMSPRERHQPLVRKTNQRTSGTQTSLFDVVGMSDNQTRLTIPEDQQRRLRLPRTDDPEVFGRQMSTGKRVRMGGETAADTRPATDKLLRTPVPQTTLPRDPLEEGKLLTTRDKHLPRVHDRHLPRAAPPGLPRTFV